MDKERDDLPEEDKHTERAGLATVSSASRSDAAVSSVSSGVAKRKASSGIAEDTTRRPKRFKNAFAWFNATRRSAVETDNPTFSSEQLHDELCQQYKQLPKKELQKYDKLAFDDKHRYEQELELWKANNPIRPPERSKTPFSHFMSEQRPVVKKKFPKATFSSIVTSLTEQWRALSGPDRQRYNDIAMKDKQRYDREMKEYKQKRQQHEQQDDAQHDKKAKQDAHE